MFSNRATALLRHARTCSSTFTRVHSMANVSASASVPASASAELPRLLRTFAPSFSVAPKFAGCGISKALACQVNKCRVPVSISLAQREYTTSLAVNNSEDISMATPPPPPGVPPPPQFPQNVFVEVEDDLKAQPIPDLIEFGNEDLKSIDVMSLQSPETSLGKQATLEKYVFGLELSTKARNTIHQVVRWQLAKRRQGTHKTKNISERSGTGKKPHPQKGTGQARAATLRSPLHRKGGRAGASYIVPRDYSFKLNRKVRSLGLRYALSSKFIHGNVLVMSNFVRDSDDGVFKTKELAKYLALHGYGDAHDNKLLIVVGDDEKQFNRYSRGQGAELVNDGKSDLLIASRNLPHVNIIPAVGLNVYDILRHRKVAFTEFGLDCLQLRLTKRREKKSLEYEKRSILRAKVHRLIEILA